MARCPAITKAGTPCKGVVKPGDTYCPAHDPARAEQRSRDNKRAGSSRPNRELNEIKTELRGIAHNAPFAESSKGLSVSVMAYNALLRAIETERRLRETEEYEERLSAIEAKLGGSRVAR